MNIIETKELFFNYADTPILQDINLKVEKGSIYGYLGKNGAGKTTTMKLLLGLLKKNSGQILFCGKDFHSNRIANLHRIGNLIEAPSIYEHFTVLEQLKYINILYQKGNKRVEEILDLIDLTKVKNRKVKHLSTGMKQRLGIGIALFNDPDLLILDEPISGLDPDGICKIRQLLLHMQESGKTIILSSHVLSEVEKLCSHIGIINKGRLIFQGEMKEVLFSAHKKVIVYCSDVLKASNILKELSISFTIQNDESLCFQVQNGYEFNKAISSLIIKLEIFNIETINYNLENRFLNIISNEE